jgi:hypothetical protein
MRHWIAQSDRLSRVLSQHWLWAVGHRFKIDDKIIGYSSEQASIWLFEQLSAQAFQMRGFFFIIRSLLYHSRRTPMLPRLSQIMDPIFRLFLMTILCLMTYPKLNQRNNMKQFQIHSTWKLNCYEQNEPRFHSLSTMLLELWTTLVWFTRTLFSIYSPPPQYTAQAPQ